MDVLALNTIKGLQFTNLGIPWFTPTQFAS
jgi:hypothetical protein